MLNWKAVRSYDELNQFTEDFRKLSEVQKQKINGEMLEMLAEFKRTHTPYQRECVVEEAITKPLRKRRQRRRR